ncbi:hypothetical protein ACQPTN_01455 [Bradyrhizobium sp. 13971]
MVDFSSVLDRTVSGGVQSTVVGSHAEFPLPSPIKDAAISVHCWAWPTVPERSAPQAIWSIGDIALVIVSGGLALRMGSAPLAVLPDAIIAKHWYSILTTIGDGEVCIDLRRLDAKVGAQRTLCAATGAMANAATLRLAASGIGPSGSPLEPYNGKIELADAAPREAIRRDDRRMARREDSRATGMGSMETRQGLRVRDD